MKSRFQSNNLTLFSVGHCHPEVVTAACQQMGILNTNSRYLSHLNSTYSQKLTSLFPAPLDTVFFVNSGDNVLLESPILM